MDTAAPPKLVNRWHPWRLRTLLYAALAFGVLFVWPGYRLQKASKNRQLLADAARAASILRSLGAEVRLGSENRSRLDEAFADPGRHWIAVVDFNRNPPEEPGSIDSNVAPSRQLTDAELIPVMQSSANSLTRLQVLSLSNTQVSNAGLRRLTRLIRLEELYLANTQVSDEGLANLSSLANLRVLDLYGTQVTDAGLIHLEQLNNLELLNLGATEVTDAGLKELFRALPQEIGVRR